MITSTILKENKLSETENTIEYQSKVIPKGASESINHCK